MAYWYNGRLYHSKNKWTIATHVKNRMFSKQSQRRIHLNESKTSKN